jgi:hypothetical protein
MQIFRKLFHFFTKTAKIPPKKALRVGVNLAHTAFRAKKKRRKAHTSRLPLFF